MNDIKKIITAYALGKVAQDDLQRIVQALREHKVDFELEVKEVPGKNGKRTGLPSIGFRLSLDGAPSSVLHDKLTALVNDIGTLSIFSTTVANRTVIPRDLWYIPRDFCAG